MRIRIYLVSVLLFISLAIYANNLDEARAIKQSLQLKFSAQELLQQKQAEKMGLLNLKRGEYETNAQFEERKLDALRRMADLDLDYEQRIKKAKAQHEQYQGKLRLRLQELLNLSRETKSMDFWLIGNYDANKQSFKLRSQEGKDFDVIVPIEKAPMVKDDIKNYQLLLTRQYNEDFEWEYLEARLEGNLGSFSSTDKAPDTHRVALIPPDLTATVAFNEPSGNKMLDAEERAEIHIEIINRGKGSANMLEAFFELKNAPGISFSRNLFFGEIKPGERISKSLNLVAGSDIRDGNAELRISFSEKNGFPPKDIDLRFATRSSLPPEIQISDIGIEDFNRNFKIEPGETVKLTVRLHNRGMGASRNLLASVVLGADLYFYGNSPSSFNLGNMAPGEYQDISFDIVSANTATKLDIKLDLRESRSQYNVIGKALDLAFHRVERTADQMVVSGITTPQQQERVAQAPALSIDIEKDIPTLAKPDKNKWGIIIGIENYRNVSPVRFARRDAEIMKEYFIKVLGIKAENIYMALDDGASLGEFKSLFDARGWLSSNVRSADNEVFIYFSGHGVPAPDGKAAYLLPYDGNPNFAANSAYDLSHLYENLSSLPAKHITLFLDSCFSGANRDNEIILADARPIFITANPQAQHSKISVFSASSGSQISSAFSDMQHGLFSYFLMKGLRGEADTNKDCKLSQKELQEYIREEVSSQARRMGRMQEPELQSKDTAREIVKW
ncbi:MAG: caspase family protein [Candidatus Cloacimonetes bacterium]|nr:caspase family protein [Candidatus Cloacimonadota bacterium]